MPYRLRTFPTHNVRANLVQTTGSADESTYAPSHHAIPMAAKPSRVILMAAKPNYVILMAAKPNYVILMAAKQP
jgi:hypothetical protein